MAINTINELFIVLDQLFHKNRVFFYLTKFHNVRFKKKKISQRIK